MVVCFEMEESNLMDCGCRLSLLENYKIEVVG